ncbi:MAG TPA: hypothetical protein VF362_04405, partial [Demequinaceae bacterium]
ESEFDLAGGATRAGVGGVEGEAEGAEEGSEGVEGDADPEDLSVDVLGDFAEVVLDFAAARESVR